MNIPSIDEAHYSRATSRVNKKKKEMTRTRSLATDIQITLTFLAIFVLTFLELHGVCRFPEIPITRRRLAFKDVSSNRETQRDQSRLIRRTSTFSFFPLGINERERERLKRRRRGPFIRVSTGETILEIPAGPRSSKANNRALHF